MLSLKVLGERDKYQKSRLLLLTVASFSKPPIQDKTRYSPRTPRMPSHLVRWNPSELFSIGPIGKCIGFAPSKGRRCRIVIAGSNADTAESLLMEMAKLGVLSAEVDELLEPLASLLLCRRWHQDQVDGIVERWEEKLRSLRVKTAARLLDLALSVPVAAPPAIRPLPRREVQTSSTTLLRRQPRASPAIRLHDHLDSESVVPTQTHRHDTERTASLPTTSTTSTTRLVEEDVHTPDRSVYRQGIIAARLAPRAIQARRQAQEPELPISPSPTLGMANNDPPRAERAPSSPPQSPLFRPAEPTEAEPLEPGRKTIEGECSICQDDLCVEDRLVWCKAQCGQNFHQECMQTWHEVSTQRRSCPYWLVF